MIHEAIHASAAARSQEPVTDPVRRWHDDMHPFPWHGCPERPCYELQRADVPEGDVLADLQGVIARWHNDRTYSAEQIIEDLTEIISWWTR